MCGLAGVVAPASFLEAAAFVDLLKISSLRGADSTGLMVSRKFVTSIYKDAVNSVTFAESLELGDILNPMKMYGDVYMAHCRYATIGDVTRKNSHPFRENDLVLAHNGTVGSLHTKGMLGTDSQLLLHKMCEKGVIPALSDLKPSDSFAVSVFDNKEKVLYLGRNAQRPLAFAVVQDTGTFFYASEPEMLQFVMKRSHLYAKIFVAEPWMLFRVDPKAISEKNMTPWTSEDIPHQEEKKKDELSETSSAAV